MIESEIFCQQQIRVDFRLVVKLVELGGRVIVEQHVEVVVAREEMKEQ